ncbi:polyprotein [Cucumis melo var. makuwa]|uniref:Polyprotein n=1 Tax=Cucumis melo var. makuwa TaxID=1194695 RepID=A0A5D3E7S4_CUCMM|nr:polyprotein [Cucumis melo var. makuwa]TYK31355.1 polyprotein [Cucumis melo var. makuwa]
MCTTRNSGRPRISFENSTVVAYKVRNVPPTINKTEGVPIYKIAPNKDTITGGTLSINNRSMTERPILEVVDATKPFEVETERFNYMLREYLRHLVDDRQMNWVLLLNVTQFGFKAQIESPIERSLFKIVCSRHSVLLPLVDHLYVGNIPQVTKLRRNGNR